MMYMLMFFLGAWCVGLSAMEDAMPIPCHDAYTMCLAFSPDGQTIATGGRADSPPVRLWDVASRRELRAFDDQKAGIYRIAFSPDGKTLASGGTDSIVRLWDLKGKVIGTLPHPGFIGGLAFSPDGKLLATGCARQDATLRVWDVKMGTVTQQLTGHEQGRQHLGILDVVFSPDGKSIASAGTDATVRVWDLAAGKARHVLKFDTVAAGVKFSPDSALLAAGFNLDESIRIYDAASGSLKLTLPNKSFGCFVFAPDGRLLYAGDNSDRKVKAFEIPSGKKVAEFAGTLGRRFQAIAISSDGKTLAWSGEGNEDGSVRVLKLAPRDGKAK